MVKKTVNYQFGCEFYPADYYTTADFAAACGLLDDDVRRLILSGQGFSYHMSEPVIRTWTRGNVLFIRRVTTEFFWRVDGVDGDSFRQNVHRWLGATDRQRADWLRAARRITKAELAEGRARIRKSIQPLREKRDSLPR